MATELRWIVSTAASSLHAAQALLAGQQLTDPKIAAALAAEVAALADELAANGLDRERFFEHAIALSVRFDVPLQLADVTLTKIYGPGRMSEAAPGLARRLVDLEAALQRANPRALEELELRAQPIIEQWDARGPGLLAGVARLTAGDLIVEAADVILVLPVLGGGGQSHWPYNSAHLEAVLANPVAELPEVVRLGWLVSQLNLELPKYSDNLARDRLRAIGPLAMLPPVLAAAEQVELAHADVQMLTRALDVWRLPADPQRLWQWWETVQATSPTWDVALGALDRMLADAE